MKQSLLITIALYLLSAAIFSTHARTLLVKVASQPSLAKSAGHPADPVKEALYGFNIKSKSLFTKVIPVAERARLGNWVAVDVADDHVAEALVRLSQTSDVLAVQENRLIPICFEPNDSLYAEQYALKKIGAPLAWDIERGSREVIVAIIDTGIDYDHPDIAGQLWLNAGEDLNGNGVVESSDFNGIDDDGNGFVDDLRGWDFTDAPNYPSGGDFLERDNDPMDEHGHGTAVSGIIAANTDNGTGMAGLAHGCRVMALRSFNANGYGEEDDAASAILYAVANGAQVINMSFGDVFVSPVLQDVIRYAASKGVVMIASSGNASTDQIHYPSGFAETISVGSSDQNDKLSGFSNYGPIIDLVAPGSSILSLDLHNSYRTWNGTSFSAPYVSAAAALLLSQQPGLAPDAVRARLVDSADDLGQPGWDEQFGAGRLNVGRLLAEDKPAVARITDPQLDTGFSSGPIVVRGTAWSPTFESYQLYWGASQNPDSWQQIGQIVTSPVIDDVLGEWQDLPEMEGDVTIKLVMMDQNGSELVHATRIFLDHSAPKVQSIEFLPMLHGDEHSLLFQLFTDDLCEGSLFYASDGAEFVEAPLTYRSTELRYNLTQDEVMGPLLAWVRLENSAGLITNVDNDGLYYALDLSQPPIDVTGFSRDEAILPFGRLLSHATDFNQNGIDELVLSVADRGAIGPIDIYESRDGSMEKVFSLPDSRIPRDAGDSDNDGKMELLCGFGFDSFIYEADVAGGFPTQQSVLWKGDGAWQYWASRFADLDADGRGEVVIRVVRPSDAGGTDQFELYEQRGDNQYEQVAAFPNPTSGENFNGVPHSVIGDFDGDGLAEIVLGDSDGDLFIYENQGDDSYHATWQDSLPLLDSAGFIAAGDFDGDGVDEFIAGCHSDPNLNTEHAYDARHWYYRLYNGVGDDLFEQAGEWRLFGFESTRDYLSSVTAGDVNGDGDDEILIAAYPDFYIIDYVDTTYEVIYHHAPVQSSGALIADADVDGLPEFWIGDGDVIFALKSVGDQSGPGTPVAVVAQPLDVDRVRVSWREIAAADFYELYRGLHADALNLLAQTLVPQFVDSSVVQGQIYFYGVKAVNTQGSSRMSRIVQAKPGLAPVIIGAQQETASAIRVVFSEPMNHSITVASNYLVDHGVGRPSSAAHDRSGSEVVLSFKQPLQPGEYAVSCFNLLDADRTPLATASNTAAFVIYPTEPAPYLTGAQVISENLVALTFDQAMEKNSVENEQNYVVDGEPMIKRATLGADQNTVELQADFANLFAERDSLTIRAANVKNASGVAIVRGRGDVVIVTAPISRDRRLVYPNPAKLNGEDVAVIFSGMAESEGVDIYSSNGRHVASLRNSSGQGDLVWNGRNTNGEIVASGIYIYRMQVGSHYKTGKLAVIR